MKKIIIIENDKIFYDGKPFNEMSIREKLQVKVKFIILNENILIKSFENLNDKDSDFINKIIEEEYGGDLDILTHYEHCKKIKKTYLYSIGNGKMIAKLIDNLLEVSIIPIQFYIKNIVNKKIRGRNTYIIFSVVKNKVYYIEVINNIIVDTYIEEKDEFDINKLKNIDKEKYLVLDGKLEKYIIHQMKNRDNMCVINMGGIIDEKILNA